jgi:hypothetical protein
MFFCIQVDLLPEEYEDNFDKSKILRFTILEE